MKRFLLTLLASGFAFAAPATAQTLLVDESCKSRQSCDMFGNCQASNFTFHFTYSEEADGSPSSAIQMPGQAMVDVLFEPMTQGYTWNNAGRVYTLLYLFNAAFDQTEASEFILIDADAAGRYTAATLYTGTCEARR